MTDPTKGTRSRIRVEVVALIVGLDCSGPPAGWKHADDGRPLTARERALVASATVDELETALDFQTRAAEHYEAHYEQLTRAEALLRRHFGELPEGARVRDVLGRVSAAERAEIEEAWDLVQLLRKLAPGPGTAPAEGVE